MVAPHDGSNNQRSAHPPPEMAASMMCADFLHLEDELDLLESGGVHFLHMDIMDGHYVPNLALSPDFCRRVGAASTLPQDVHLMVEDVDRFVPMFTALEPQYLSFHPETSRHAVRTIQAIRSAGVTPGIALDPAVTVASVAPLLQEVGLVCVMSVSPGYSGQQLIPWTLDKLSDLAARRDAHNLDFKIEVDGNASWENIPGMVAAGADVIVGGTSSIFDSSMPRERALARARRLLERTAPQDDGAHSAAPRHNADAERTE
ncbi:MAG: ribulose-phosphate 3-epimerase [Spirochaetota bacterium]